MVLEAHLFDYGHTGHFWVKGYEYLRQLEYRLAILHDKLEYLGEEFCGKEERQLASLAEFPPLNYCCYPAVPKKYRTVTEPDWNPSEAALQVMCELAKEAGDVSLLRALGKVSQEARAIPCKAAWETNASHAACSSRGFADRAAYGGRRNL